MKNATFSNKFDAGPSCFCYEHDLPDRIARIMYESLCVDAFGETEVVVRERISYDSSKVPCVYNGLPFRPEFRVFYDFDLKKPLYTVNYWDYEYCYPQLYDLTDKIVFNAMREQLEDTFIGYKDHVQELVSDAMKNVEGLTGPWSIDIMMKGYPENDSCDLEHPCDLWGSHDRKNGVPMFYLIDMALAERSSYWGMRKQYDLP